MKWFIFILFLYSCSYLYNGKIIDKYIDNSYYEIKILDDTTRHYRTENYYDSIDESTKTRQVYTHTTYDGTYFREYYYEKLYIIKVEGIYKDKVLQKEFIIDEKNYNILIGNIPLKEKDSYFTKYLYPEKCFYWRKSIKTNELYIKDGSRIINEDYFNRNYKQSWIDKRIK